MHQGYPKNRFRKALLFIAAAATLWPGSTRADEAVQAPPVRHPNILIAIADDWSWPDASIAGTPGIQTPNFDRVAREGVLFTNAFCAAPQCSPNRAALLTGRHIWQLEEAGTHSSLFPTKFEVLPDRLEQAGYFVGFTGKGWGPGAWKESGRPRNPAGPEYNRRRFPKVPWSGIHPVDYAGNFESFLEQRTNGAPFCFWYGGHEPHRKYEVDSGRKSGKKLEDVKVPAYLPDDLVVRGDLLDYFLEVEWFDEQLGKMLRQLEAIGELDNTIVIVTGDNGLSFPHAKANVYERGVHVPLAIRWGQCVQPGRTVPDLISFVDFAPTLLEAAGLTPGPAITGTSFLPLLTQAASGPNRYVFFGRERHSHARFDNMGYPARAIRTPDYLYIENLKPDRWPAGDPEQYYDIDDSPAKSFMQANAAQYPALFAASFGKRPPRELYAVQDDPDCIKNLAESPDVAAIEATLHKTLTETLTRQRDPRALGNGDVFDTYPRFGGMRPELGGFAKAGVANTDFHER